MYLKIKRGIDFIEANKKVILFVRRLSPIKRTLFYLPYIIERYCKACEDVVFYIIGDGEDKSQLENLINESSALKNKVFVIGKVPNKVIQEYYQAADIFINPTYEEGFPRVLLEAMACGLPVVTTDAGGIKDLIGLKQTQYMVDKDDRDSFGEKLLQLIQDEDMQRELSRENQFSAGRFSTENVSKMYVDKIFK